MANGRKKINNNKLLSVIKGIAVYVLIAVAALFFFYAFSGPPPSQNNVPISQIIADIKEDRVEKITLEGDKIQAKLKDADQPLFSRKEEGESIYKILESSGVDP